MGLIFKFDPSFDFFFLKNRVGRDIHYKLDRKASIKDIMEALGVPHTEVGQIVFNETAVDFSFHPEKNGVVRIKPPIVPYDITKPGLLRPNPFDMIRFVADVNVMRLGRLLILLGFDVSCSQVFTDEKIADIAESESRIVLTRDTRLLNRKKIIFARRIRENKPYDQLVEVIRFFGLKRQIRFLTRCTGCNRPLVRVEKAEILHILEPKTKKYYEKFLQCPDCGKVYWKGSHYDNLRASLNRVGL